MHISRFYKFQMQLPHHHLLCRILHIAKISNVWWGYQHQGGFEASLQSFMPESKIWWFSVPLKSVPSACPQVFNTKISRTNRTSNMRSSLNIKWSHLLPGNSLEKYIFAGTDLKVLVRAQILDAKVLVSVWKSILKTNLIVWQFVHFWKSPLQFIESMDF